jgi:hypothetical protein
LALIEFAILLVFHRKTRQGREIPYHEQSNLPSTPLETLSMGVKDLHSKRQKYPFTSRRNPTKEARTSQI